MLAALTSISNDQAAQPSHKQIVVGRLHLALAGYVRAHGGIVLVAFVLASTARASEQLQSPLLPDLELRPADLLPDSPH